MTIKNQVQLITYPDSLGGDLSALCDVLVKHFTDIFPGGIHILPPFPSSGDRGFAPRTYAQIDPTFGAWKDLRKLSQKFDIMVDLMVNHISRHSPYFQGFLQKGRRSEYADLFITLDKIWPDGDPPARDVAKIFLRRPDTPFLDVRIQETGEVERIWATFGEKNWSEQIDLDVNSPLAQDLLREILTNFSRQGITQVRLDAVAYVTKKAGTSCFFVEPDIFEFLDWIEAEASALGITLLPEVHTHHSIQARLAGYGLTVYNFVLPFLVLHGLLSGSAQALKDHLRTCPRNQVTMLDCHDGIPVLPDIEGVIGLDEAQDVVNTCVERGANLSRIFSKQHKTREGFDVHQVNCTYYSALNCQDDAYLAARAIQFFSPGIPQVYYVGLLAGENDAQAIESQGDRRANNRHNYSVAEIEIALQKPVVRRLLELIRFRNEYPAFNGEFNVLESGPHELRLSWERGESGCTLSVDLETARSVIEYRQADGTPAYWTL